MLESAPIMRCCNEGDKVLAFERGDCLVVFNFHPVSAYSGYAVECPPGEYRIVLNSDSTNYHGFGNVKEQMVYKTSVYEGRSRLQLYLPPRVAMVFRKCILPENL